MLFTVNSLVSLATLLTLINAVQGCASSVIFLTITHRGLTSRQVISAVGEREAFPAVPGSLVPLPVSVAAVQTQVNSAVGEREVFPAVPASLVPLPASESSLRFTHHGLTSGQRSNFSSSGRMPLSLNWGGEPHMRVNGGGKVEDG
ncbi:hypothetical protein C8J57DRAFT_1241373 [Mycena rebaudengoi]|nr:hypothetical protein C8J57DRAFT_1241373 [Mycena rebaudengoi]